MMILLYINNIYILLYILSQKVGASKIKKMSIKPVFARLDRFLEKTPNDYETTPND